MKTFFTIRTIAFWVILSSLFLFSCQKESSQDDSSTLTEDEARLYADESVQAEASFDDAEDVGRIAAEEEGTATENSLSGAPRILPSFDELRLRLGSCVVVTVTPNDNSYPKTIRIDFGAGCMCTDGKFRKGAIVLHLTGPIRRPGSVLTISFDEYYINRAHIEGTKIISNLSEGGNIKFTVQVVAGKVTLPNGRGYEYNCLRYVHQVAGGLTRMVRDDIYHIEGRSNTSYNGGLSITLNTETPLVKKVVCPWISNGELKIRLNNRILFLDFGAPDNGACDNKALLTWNNGSNQLLVTIP